ncbi:substrate-binding periplasmic protein [Nakamurella lactea]|uniref:substrate-binding periplasmic protein n=1 Tax=Nakamurella lactea TaxID=459515 RepID=UPI000686854D|nr:transporter substrate-binding domain-containing protein [Nakamurella lactea]
MARHRRSTQLVAVIAALATFSLSACGSDTADPGVAESVTVTPDWSSLTKIGWTPAENSLPSFACTDGSYAKAVKDGINLGIYSAAPYEYIDSKTNEPAGLDWEINMAVLAYIGVTDIKTTTLQWDGMIPALTSSRIDVITGNIHETPDRLKNIAFTAPAWWYGSALLIPEDNPGNIKSWEDLKRKDVKVGVVNGSQSQAYVKTLGSEVIAYQDANAEFASLVAGREDVVVDDSPKAAEYIMQHPDSGLTILKTEDVPPNELLANYARYGLRKSDCTLNAAYSRALSELRAHGVITTILKNYGLTDNFFQPPYGP